MPKRYKGITFEFKGAHLAYTEKSQGGAASLKNDYYLTKAKEGEESLTENQKKLLEIVGEEFTPLDKSLESEQPAKAESASGSSSSVNQEGVTGEELEKTNHLENEETMSDVELQKQLDASTAKMAEMTKKLARMEAKEFVSPLKLKKELEEEVTSVFAELSNEARATLVKAFEETRASALEVKKKTEEENNALGNTLSKELGHEEEESSEPLTLSQRVQKAKEQQKSGGAK